jgi:tetratricopeptide (TPR) repeat protein
MAFFMHVLQPEVDPQEAQALKGISAEWEKRKESNKPSRPRVSGLFMAIAAAIIVLVGVSSLWIVMQQWTEPESAEEVVGLLLEKDRPFEARISGQPHRSIEQTRGPGDEVSYNLLAGEMTRLSANSHEMGRFHLLEKDFSKAISYLEIAEQEVGAGADVHNDLGVAYLENGSGSQYAKAETEFLHALQHDRSFAAAAFNLALFYERTNATALAQAQWKRYLELDSTSDWAMEAEERLQRLSR